MTKLHKHSDASVETRPRRSAVSMPEVIHMDDLAVMADEDLIVHFRTLEDNRNRACETYLDPRPWEEELAYVRREQQVRKLRRDAHVEFCRSSEEEFSRAEASLPPGDFDNSAFVYAATGGRPRWN